MSLLKVCAQICVLASIWAGVALPAQAQDYPARTITIVVPLAPGSGMDAARCRALCRSRQRAGF
jgi:tripartite-type tricarboxylate transporter receptor subunit TctC